jgi:predicted metalloprotease
VVLGLVGWALGIDPRVLIGGAEVVSRNSPSYQQPYQPPIQRRAAPKTGQPKDEAGRFVSKVLAQNEDRWREVFQQSGRRYEPPHLVLFRGRVTSACGLAQSAMGPFYCPGDRKIYLDTSFFGELERRFRGCDGKACQFSQAYVIAHEYGHHVQNLLGILPKAQQMQHGVVKTEANRIQVRVELQADCFAGVWANHQQKKQEFLDAGDVEAALKTASAIGDDRLQRQAKGTVVPDSFTHGASEQRMRWFNTGFKNGTVESCNTFAAANL